MADVRPVEDWGIDFDVLSRAYVDDPFTIWDDLRTRCPVAHTDRRGSTWLPTTYKDVVALAHDIDHFSSLDITVIPFTGEEPDEPVLPYGVPPISVDPPHAHLDPPAPAPVVLPPQGGELRIDDPRPVQPPDRRIPGRRAGRRRGRLRPADPGHG